MRLILAVVILVVSIAGTNQAEDWSTWQHDARRSGYSGEKIDSGKLMQEWVWRSAFPPQPAWHGPAKWDAYARIRDLPSMRSYDLVFHVVSVGDAVYFGSSADDAVRCLDAASGQVRWKFVTDAPVRIAPTIADGRVFFGSDDGFAYCLDAESGELIWRFRPAEPGPLILNNGRLIPQAPCRTGVLINGENAWFACGMLPWEATYLCSVNASSGKLEGAGTFVRKLNGRTLEGSPALSSKLVLFPQGRVAPQIFGRADGGDLGTLKKSGGGSIVVVSLDSTIFHGPATDSRRGGIGRSDPKTMEMVAGYGRGSALVVSERASYMLADDELIASDLATRKVLFQVPCELRLSLAGAGNLVFAGGEDAVAAFDATSGKRVWQNSVDGKAYGLAIANGRVWVSTDVGAIYSFAASSDSQTIAKSGALPASASSTLIPVKPVKDEHLLGRWVFQTPHVRGKHVDNLASGRPGRTTTGAGLVTVGKRQALELDGSGQSVLVAENHREAKLPKRTISAEAWVRIDDPLTWGGLVGAVQDNGDFERGWLLGYRDSKFSFAIAGTEGNGRLTYLTAKSDFTLGHWQHVAATYDGSTMILYVNGQPVATSKVQSGDIRYPPQAFYEIGAYHDKDEYHRLRGAIHEVRVYDDVLSAEEIASHYSAKADAFPLPTQPFEVATGPWLEFTGPSEAIVRWHTDEPSMTNLQLNPMSGPTSDPVVHEDETPTRTHEVRLQNLKRNRIYSYVIRADISGQRVESREFECDTFFNYTVPPLTPDESPDGDDSGAARTVRRIGTLSGVDRGVAVVVGLTDGTICRELIRQTRLRLVCVDDDAARVRRLRDSLAPAYGVRVSIHHVNRLDRLPFVGHWANLVVTERPLGDELPTTPSELTRLLLPDTGIAVLGHAGQFEGLEVLKQIHSANPDLNVTTFEDENGLWSIIRSDKWQDVGQWTHLYGTPDNTAFAGETLMGARSSNDLTVQWVGRPGPRYQADRSGRKPSPLAAGGRLFLQGLERIIALDSYNGSVLWSLEIPGFSRFNVPRDAGNWCADRENVFAVVRDKVWQINAATGEVVRMHDVESIDREGWKTDWGFVARAGDKLIGTSVKAGSSWQDYWGKSGWHDARSGPSTFQIGSDRLFARMAEDGSEAWSWSSGVVLNPTITISNGVVYFVECRHADVTASQDRRLGSPELWKDQFLVAIDANTGSKLWEKSIDTVDGTVAFYMAHAQDKLVIVSSAGAKFQVSTMSDTDGRQLWEQTVGWIEGKGDHGKALSRPAIVGDKLFVRPQVLSLTDGKPLGISMPGGGCGTYACTSNALFFRSGNVTVWDSETGKSTVWPRLRPDCWLSTIPAGGMLLSPEGGGGCSCGSWMETSIGFMPAARRQPNAANPR